MPGETLLRLIPAVTFLVVLGVEVAVYGRSRRIGRPLAPWLVAVAIVVLVFTMVGVVAAAWAN